MATGSENLDIVIKARGGRQAAAEVAAVERELGALGKTAGSTRVVIDGNTESSRRSSSAFATNAKMALQFATAAGLVKGALSGINFVSSVEQNTIAFEQFLGSTKAASEEIAALRQLANDIPQFGFDQFATNAKKLLAMGTPLARVNKDLKTFAETAQGLGLGAEGVDRITLAIGQMRSTGVVQGDELRQLQEAGIKVYDYLIQAGIITKKDIGQIGNLHIESARAIDAIMNGMAKDFGGLSARARGTWSSQLGALKNNAAAAAGALVEPIMKFAESDVLPKLSKFFKDASVWLQQGGAGAIYETLGKLTPAIEAATGAWLAYKGAVVLVITAQKVSAFFGVIGALIAVIPLLWAAATGTGSLAAAWVAFDVAVDSNAIVIAITAIIVAISAVVVLFAKSEGARNAFLGFWHALGAVLSKVWDTMKAISGWSWKGLLGGGPRGKGFDIPGIPFMANGGTIPVGGAAVVGDAGPEIARNTGRGTEITPMAGGVAPAAPQWRQPIQFAVDGRVFAEVIMDQGMTAAARG